MVISLALIQPAIQPSGRQLKALVFDMDGTLLDTSDAMCRGAVSAVKALTNRIVSCEAVREVWDVATPEELLSRLLKRSSGGEDVETYLQCLDRELVDVKLYDHMNAALANLSTRIPLALYTGTNKRVAEIVLGRTKVRHRFSYCVFGDDVTSFKPNPEGIVVACKLLGVDPTATAYIGDSPKDLVAARACGALAVAAAWGYRYDAESKASETQADVVLRSPSDIQMLVAPCSTLAHQ